MILLLLSLSFGMHIKDLFSLQLDPTSDYYSDRLQLNTRISLVHPGDLSQELKIPSEINGQINKNIFFTSKKDVLADSERRISNEFKVPNSLKRRVGFWLDIYTKYDDKHAVLHDRDYPWVVYEVVNVNEHMKGNDHYWTRYHRAKRYIEKRKLYWSQLIYRLSKKQDRKNLSLDEKKVLRHFQRSKYLKLASKRIRSQTGQRNHFEEGLSRSLPYLPEIEEIFLKNGLPFELTRLPLVESSFNPKAESKAGAKGIWQIMPSIGRKLGLMKSGKDMRSDIIASTNAAATLFKQKFRILEEWPLAVTAYNHGPIGVRSAVRKLRTTDITQIVRNYESRRFGFASQNFYASFLAALYAERYQEVFFHGLDKNLILSLNEDKKDKKSFN